ncbi:CPBP family intramembrane metalloprotease [Bacteroides sp. OttesenSCG-928-D19]|nr:CPBP family intramembrane metalloprotease [Bacteroides sp. OttesenSCG-928-D19]
MLAAIGSLMLPFQLISHVFVYEIIFRELVSWLLSSIAVTALAFLFLKDVEKASMKELGLSIRGRARDCIFGLVWAVVLYLIGFSLSLLLGIVRVTEVHFDFIALALTFIVFFFASVTEEVVVRGYIQGRLMTKMNKFSALVIASAIFAVMHISNPHIGVLPLVNLFLAGIMLGASYMYTRNLWFPIMLHLAWNWIQGPVLGYEVSGTKLFPSVLTLSLPENTILNGGAFGFEGSIICSVLMIISAAIIIVWGEKKSKNNINKYEV